jgi:hypothetical protein
MTGRAPVEAHATKHGVWMLLGAASAIVAFFLGAVSNVSVLRFIGWSGDTASVAVIGISIVFTGVVVSCFFLIAARINAFTSMSDDLADVDRQISRAESHVRAIRRYSKVTETGQP